MVVDPGGTLWVSSSYLLAYKTANGWMSYEYVLTGGGGRRMGRSMAAERAGRIWIQGDGAWIGVFESGQFYRTPIGSNPDVFASPINQPPQKLYYDGEVLWTAGRRLGRWRLPQPPTSVDEQPSPGSSGQSRLFDSYPNPFNARTTIGFELDRRQPVSLRVHNLTGQRGDDAGGRRLSRGSVRRRLGRPRRSRPGGGQRGVPVPVAPCREVPGSIHDAASVGSRSGNSSGAVSPKEFAAARPGRSPDGLFQRLNQTSRRGASYLGKNAPSPPCPSPIFAPWPPPVTGHLAPSSSGRT